MSDSIRPPTLETKPLCPECGAQLLPEGIGPNTPHNMRLVCPVHGDCGDVHDFRRQFAEKFRDDLQKLTDEKVEELRRTIGPGAFGEL